MVAVHFTTA